MDAASIASAMTALRAAETQAAIQYAVAAKMMNSQRSQGNAVVQLLEAAQQNMAQGVTSVSDAIANQLDITA